MNASVGGTVTPIKDYALIGDRHTAALISRDGSIDWLCLPRFDSPACFAALLHQPGSDIASAGSASSRSSSSQAAGHWTIRPVKVDDDVDGRLARDYDDHTLILRTRWTTGTGCVDVVDFMPPRREAADIVRTVEGVTGTVTMESVIRLRFDYGRVTPWVRTDTQPSREVSAVAGPDAVWVHADVPMHVGGDSAATADVISAQFTINAGDRVSFVLTHRPSHEPRPTPTDPRTAFDQTRQFWSDWIAQCTYQGRWNNEVRRSLLLLKALTYAPTGGIVAAATTSLPEQLGGVRNWDYRYCWLRDATFTLRALLGTGYTAEAQAWREWLVRAVAGDPSKLQIMYGLDGTPRLPESELPWLSGYGGSRPVRVGNAAASQFQLDVWGEALDGLYQARGAGLEATHTAWGLQRALLDWLEGHWEEPDNGLWEMRGPRRHFTHSKVMAWAGVDRAIRTVFQHQGRGLDGPVDEWRRLAAHIHDDVCTFGYDTRRGTFTQYYGSHGLDASLLLIPRVGFLPYTDPRVVGTVEAVETELRRDGFMLRYDPAADGGPDGLPGTEAPFIVCGFWLADALHGVGHTSRAEAHYEQLLSLRNDVGMLSEEYDPATGTHLGNTPQAFSLVGLVNTALHLDQPTPTHHHHAKGPA